MSQWLTHVGDRLTDIEENCTKGHSSTNCRKGNRGLKSEACVYTEDLGAENDYRS